MTRKILVVEDDGQLRTVVRLGLEAEGYSVSEAESGKVAEVLLEQERFDLVLTDIMMPDKDGLETVALVHRNYPDVPILAISSHTNRTYLDMAVAFGAVGAVEKPFEMTRLVELIERAMQPE